jgi:hypothetical protein
MRLETLRQADLNLLVTFAAIADPQRERMTKPIVIVAPCE